MEISLTTLFESYGPLLAVYTPCIALIYASIWLFDVSTEDEVDNIMGPLLFLKTEGDMHLLPSS